MAYCDRCGLSPCFCITSIESSKQIESLRSELAAVKAQREEYREAAHESDQGWVKAKQELAAVRADYDRACKTIALMHAAAVGEITGPKRGVVEDVADVRAELEREKAKTSTPWECWLCHKPDTQTIVVNFRCCSEHAPTHIAFLKQEKAAAEKERDEALASVAVLVEACEAHEYGRHNEWVGCHAVEEAVINLPAATLALLREVEALRGIVGVVREDFARRVDPHGCFGHVCSIDHLGKRLAALDAVEAGRKG